MKSFEFYRGYCFTVLAAKNILTGGDSTGVAALTCLGADSSYDKLYSSAFFT